MEGRTAGQSDRRSDLGGSSLSDRPTVRPSVLVIQTAFLGDVVLTTPLLSVLAARHGPVDVVTTPAAAGLLENHPAVSSVIAYDKRGAGRGWPGLRNIGTELRSRGYERVYLPHRSLRSAVLALWSGAGERIGFAGAPAAITYTSRVERFQTGHEVERLLALAGAGQEQAAAVTLELRESDHARADAWLTSHGVGARFAAIAPGSVWGTKRWPYY